ncbi:MAG: hypothetical protein JJU13_00460 [Balneolaceae bacterium]|nr:hypothetical protein [Balneolaceae bacterium]
MKSNRKEFLKKAGLAGISLASGGVLKEFLPGPKQTDPALSAGSGLNSSIKSAGMNSENHTIIGGYGKWAASLIEQELPEFSYRRNEWDDVESWHKAAKQRLKDRLAIPDIGRARELTVQRQYAYDGLQVEELSWKLPYGEPAEAILLKPQNASGPLPGILGFHDHAANKYFGKRKITRTSDEMHPVMESHQENYYEGVPWANEIAKRGYVVLVSDAFPFASRRVLMSDIPEGMRRGLSDEDPENPENIEAYNDWAVDHEHIMAKSLFSAGTTWPGVFFAEDRVALDILCERNDVDEARVGCGGLSGGGMRTVFMTALDERIKCGVSVGFMTTWKDLVLYKAHTHTWMTYVPLLPNELEFPEVFGLNLKTPTLVQNNIHDALFTLAEMERADEIQAEVYQKTGNSDRYKGTFHPGPHKFDKPMQDEAFEWFDQWLKG